eukprot:TRINITY_DN4013_c0_g1_i2.p1 TRINITY_DN4013_c0_g1~~TRINITY_DN4013_c0_g1_i2.p1  ORF type:complete len:549 (+),score=176.12 TRINITY_DN4013_c0_g1_i2:317-1963(+)
MSLNRRKGAGSDTRDGPSSPDTTPKKRATRNDILSDHFTASTNERTMQTIFDMYAGASSGQGIMHIAEALGIKDIFYPRKKINVMIIGNHSSGKSSFINWYVGEHVQKTGVAIETQGFTLVTSGKKRETLLGVATLQLFPHLSDIKAIQDTITKHLATEVSISNERKFAEITFLDTPGLVDGSFNYTFPVDEAILWWAQYADLILLFFDPIGQALCHRTMSIVERLNENYGDKMRYYLSKADDVDNEQDRQKVLIQITQNLSSKIRNQKFDLPTIYLPRADRKSHVPNAINEILHDIEKTINLNVQRGLNQLEIDSKKIVDEINARLDRQKVLIQITQNLSSKIRNQKFDLPTIYLPRADRKSHVPNAINEILHDIEKTINLNVQRGLNQLEIDSKKIVDEINARLDQDAANRRHNSSAARKGLMYSALACLMPIILVMYIMCGVMDRQTLTQRNHFYHVLVAVQTVAHWLNMLPEQYSLHFMLALGVLFIVFILASKWVWRYKPTLTKKDVSVLRDQRRYIEETVMQRKHDLYQDYFAQFVSGEFDP